MFEEVRERFAKGELETDQRQECFRSIDAGVQLLVTIIVGEGQAVEHSSGLVYFYDMMKILRIWMRSHPLPLPPLLSLKAVKRQLQISHKECYIMEENYITASYTFFSLSRPEFEQVTGSKMMETCYLVNELFIGSEERS